MLCATPASRSRRATWFNSSSRSCHGGPSGQAAGLGESTTPTSSPSSARWSWTPWNRKPAASSRSMPKGLRPPGEQGHPLGYRRDDGQQQRHHQLAADEAVLADLPAVADQRLRHRILLGQGGREVEAVLLVYLETGSHKAAVHRLGISESTSRQRVSQAIGRVGRRTRCRRCRRCERSWKRRGHEPALHERSDVVGASGIAPS